MNKKIIISVIVIVIAAIGFFFYQKAQAPSLENQTEVINEQAQSAVGGGVEKTNPFNVDVSPYQGYTNPFE